MSLLPSQVPGTGGESGVHGQSARLLHRLWQREWGLRTPRQALLFSVPEPWARRVLQMLQVQDAGHLGRPQGWGLMGQWAGSVGRKDTSGRQQRFLELGFPLPPAAPWG